MAYFQLDANGEVADGTPTAASVNGNSTTLTAVNPSHVIVVNNTDSAVRFTVTGATATSDRQAAGHEPGHNSHADGSHTLQSNRHLTMTASATSVALTNVSSTHKTSGVVDEYMYILQA